MLSGDRNCGLLCAVWWSKLWLALCFLVIDVMGCVVLSGDRNCGLRCAILVIEIVGCVVLFLLVQMMLSAENLLVPLCLQVKYFDFYFVFFTHPLCPIFCHVVSGLGFRFEVYIVIGLCFSLVGSRVVLPGQLINPYIHTKRVWKANSLKNACPILGQNPDGLFLPHVQIEFWTVTRGGRNICIFTAIISLYMDFPPCKY